MKPNYHQYHITETGKIYLNGKLHPTRKNKDGDVIAYLKIGSIGDSIRTNRTVRVAQAVCDVYMTREKGQQAIIFKDGDKTNIHPDNMIPMSTSEAGRYHAAPKPKPKEVDIDIMRMKW